MLYFLNRWAEKLAKNKFIYFLPIVPPFTWRNPSPGRCYHSAQKNAVEFALNPVNRTFNPVHYSVDLEFEVNLRSSA
jgi:hypothetical protein